MLFAFAFALLRFMQIVTLIPIMGMLAYFVHGYVQLNQLTPNYILVLFIVSILALAWCIVTLFSYHRSSANAAFVSLVDLGFFGVLIYAIYLLGPIGNANCTTVSSGDALISWFGPFGSGSISGLDVQVNKTCAMLKACFALGIMNIIFFFFTAILAWFHRDHDSHRGRKTYYTRETHVHRHGHRHSRSPARTRSRHSSRHSRRVYV